LEKKRLGVKASVGIHSKADVEEMVKAGATRIGAIAASSQSFLNKATG